MTRFLLLTVFSFLTFFATAQVPANDNCEDAIQVFTGIVTTFSNVDATVDGPFHPDCMSNMNDTIFADIWYVWTSDFSGLADWSLCSTADFDTKIAVYQAGTTCPLSDADLLVCNDDGGGCDNATSRIFFDAAVGETYLLRLGGWGETAPGEQGSGSFTISEFTSVVDNDLCQFATPVSLGEDQAVTNLGATTDGPEHPGNSACFGFGDASVQADIWYVFSPATDMTVEWSTCDQINFDSRMAVYNAGATCPVQDGDLYTCNDDGAGCDNFTSRLIFDVLGGETYLLRLGGYSGEQGSGTFDLIEIEPPVPPANDLCMNADSAYIVTAEQAEAFDFPIEGSTINGSFDQDNFIYPNPQCFTFNTTSGEFSDVWYKFNNNGNEELELQLLRGLGSEGAEFFIELFESCDMMVDTTAIFGSCAFLDEATAVASTVVTGLSPEPTEYYLRVVTRLTSQAPGDFFFFIVGTPPSATAEEFPGTVSLFPNPVSEQLHLNIHLEEAANTHLDIYNALGQNISSRDEGQLSAGQHAFQFDTSAFGEGVYYLTVRSENGASMMKFVKSR